MGWRFRRSIRILPGIRLNFGKRGLTSTTVGKGWFSTNISKGGVRSNVNVPGTGLSYRSQPANFAVPAPGQSTKSGLIAMLVVGGILFCSGVLCCRGPQNNTAPPAANIQPTPVQSVYRLVTTPTPKTNKRNKQNANSNVRSIYERPAAIPGSTYPTQSRRTASPYTLGPRGGCYYINGNGHKTYVDHSNCY